MSDRAEHRSDSPSAAIWAGFLLMCFGMFMAILDIQIVITSLPVIEEALKIDAERMSWVQTSYLIAEVIAIPLTGLLTRVLSLRWLFAGAIAMFTLASIGSAFSTGFGTLTLPRVLQGLAVGVRTAQHTLVYDRSRKAGFHRGGRCGGGQKINRKEPFMTRLHDLLAHGQSVWLDNISRDLLRSGELKN